jgi:hypothetical protein
MTGVLLSVLVLFCGWRGRHTINTFLPKPSLVAVFNLFHYIDILVETQALLQVVSDVFILWWKMGRDYCPTASHVPYHYGTGL